MSTATTCRRGYSEPLGNGLRRDQTDTSTHRDTPWHARK